MKIDPNEVRYLERPFKLKSIAKGDSELQKGQFEGYGSVFDVVDDYAEIVAKGAFKKSLKEHKARKSMPALLWQHNSDWPIGKYIEMSEDDAGLLVKGQLALGIQRGAEAHELLQMDAINGLSIGFRVRNYEVDKTEGLITLTDIDLWEVSLVTFPANREARVADVKAMKQIATVRDFENFLRDSGGFTKEQAVVIASKGYKALQDLRDSGTGDADELASLGSILTRAQGIIKP
jgi:HK97 family phage prohead protease